MEGSMDYDLKGKVIIVTGANSGIGKAAAMQLARYNAVVVLACRSAERGKLASDDIRQAIGNQSVDFIQVNLASQQSIHDFAELFKSRYSRLDVLIHNAANFDHNQKKPVITDDGCENVFATNHLGPFLLTHLLLDMLKASAPSRIITVASKGLMAYPFLDIEFENINGQRMFSLQHAYYHSKQAQVMFTFYLAEQLKGTGVSVHCVRVGNVAIPDERLGHLPKWLLRVYNLKRQFSLTPEKMAETYVWLAADPLVGQQTGGLWDAPNKPVKANRNAYNLETQQRLWTVSEELTKVR
jgi:NAD(P)-dependent dehydrogenase (short-subunit alcohol dehydrogenase family)